MTDEENERESRRAGRPDVPATWFTKPAEHAPWVKEPRWLSIILFWTVGVSFVAWIVQGLSGG